MNFLRYACILAVVGMVTAVSACNGTPKPTVSKPIVLKFDSPAAASITTGASSAVQVSVTDPSATIRESGELPAGLSFLPGPPGTATLVGTVLNGGGGQYPVELTATDAGKHATQHLMLTVNQAPLFPAVDSSTFVATMWRSNKIVIITTGYPTATLSYSGTLPSSFSFNPAADGTATITASPGLRETPCDSQISVIASNGVTTARMTMLIKISSLACPCNLLCHTFASAAPALGSLIIKNGKTIGQYVIKGGKVVAQTVKRSGSVVETVAADGAEGVIDG
jgi:hypothetical protein